MATMGELRQATIDARDATGLDGIGTECRRGLFRVVHVATKHDATIVDPLSEWLGPDAVIATLRAIAHDSDYRKT
jgi:hypothetical protein